MSIISMLMSGGNIKPTNGPVLYATISSNTETYTFNPSKVSGYKAGNTTATLTISDNIYLYSNDITIPALTVSGWDVNDTVYIVNKGYILGRGGDGGTYSGSLGTIDGKNGGTAISLSSNTTIFNYNSIAGGGGGGAPGNFTNTGAGGGGAGGGYGGATFSGSLGSGSTTGATLNFEMILTGVTNFIPTADIVVRSVGYNATTYGLDPDIGGIANNAFIRINGTNITCRDRLGRIIFNPPKVQNVGDVPLSSRGINVVVLNPQDLAVESAICYDTWDNTNTGDNAALLTALQNIPTGRIVVMEVLDASTMTQAISDYLISNYGATATNPTTWVGLRRALVFIGTKGGQPNSALYVITNADSNAMIVASASFTGGSSTGSIASGGIAGAIGSSGTAGSIVTSSAGINYGSGGGGGRIIDGTGGQGGKPGVNIRGFGGGTGGGGGGAEGSVPQADGGSGGTINATGSNATFRNSNDGGGGGGGWGASGGKGTALATSAGLGGKAIEKNGKQLIISSAGTIYGSIV